VWIAEEVDSFSERGLGVGRICRSDVIDDIRLDAVSRTPVYKENEFEPRRRLDRL